MDKNKSLVIGVVLIIIAFVIGFAVGKSTKSTKQTNSNNSNVETNKVNTNVDNGASKKEAKAVNLGEKIDSSDINMTFDNVNFKKEIKWSTGSYSSRSVSIGEGKVALSLSGSFKNLKGEAIKDDNIVGKVIVDDKYTYDLSFKPHVSGYEVEPLETVEYDFYAQVPKEIQDTYSKIEFIFGYNNDFSYVSTTYINGKQVDKLETVDNLYSLTATK